MNPTVPRTSRPARLDRCRTTPAGFIPGQADGGRYAASKSPREGSDDPERWTTERANFAGVLKGSVPASPAALLSTFRPALGVVAKDANLRMATNGFNAAFADWQGKRSW